MTTFQQGVGFLAVLRNPGVGFEPTSPLQTQGYEPCNLPLLIP